MKKYTVILLTMVMLLFTTACSQNTAKYKIGVIQLADHPSLDAAYEGMKQELETQLGSETVSIDYQNAQGDLLNADLIVNKFVSDKVDLIYAIGTNAAQAAMNATSGTDIKVIFNAVTDPVAGALVQTLEVPGGNVSGVSDMSPLEKQLGIINEITPNAKKVGVLYNIGEINSQVQVDLLKQTAPKLGLEIVAKGISNTMDVSTAATQLAADVDVFFNITDNMVVAATATLIDVANRSNKPVFASEDGQFDQGILATASLSYMTLGKQAGLMIYDILENGTDITTLPVYQSKETVLYVNQDVAIQLGIELSETVFANISER